MGMTMAEKILAAHAGKTEVVAGELIEANLDGVLGNDVTTPPAIQIFKQYGFTKVFDPDKIFVVLDHFTPAKDIKAAQNCKVCREFAHDQKIPHFYETGDVGIEHALLPEKGLVVPGDIVVGADSHTCTYGALGAFSTGVGSTDLAASMATGKLWFKVPSSIKFHLTGSLKKWVSGKDVILHIIGMIGVDGALYESMEFCGPGVSSLTMDDRFTIANMAIEAGGKNAIFPVDEQTKEYLSGRTNREFPEYTADPDAQYSQTFEIDLSKIEPTVAFPSLPENTKVPSEWGTVVPNQVVIGSCTNGRISDLAVAAEIMDGKRVADGIRCIVFPATQEIYLEALKEGYIQVFIEAGAAVSTPTCGPCLGGHMGVLAPGEVAVATTNRNFLGRMGDNESQVYLASPAVAAATAIAGKLTTPDQV